MKYQRQQILQGNRLKLEAEESPQTFGTENGASFSEPAKRLDETNATRFAGPVGAFAMRMMTDPNLANGVKKWDEMFVQSNEGLAFNQAKMALQGGANPDQQQQGTNQ